MTSLLWNAQTAEARATAAERADAAAAPASQLRSRLGGSEARALAYRSSCGGFESRPRSQRVVRRTRLFWIELVLIPLRNDSSLVSSRRVRLSFVRCPNGSACPDGSTCCLRSSGLYGCCPYPFAVCCSDHQHCCPEGYHCNLSNGSCVQISTSVKEIQTLLTAMVLSPQTSVNYKAKSTAKTARPAVFSRKAATAVVRTLTLCAVATTRPAVRKGYQCKVSIHTCIAGNSTVPTLKKVSTIDDSPPENPTAVGKVQCPDKNYCQDGQTCCLLSEGRYGCCPYPHAVCCSDHASCCPEGYQCKVSTHTCIAGNSTVPMLEKVSTIDESPAENPAPVEKVQCPDKNYCQDGQTCCLLSEGRYGCCPYPHAVCCSDHASCCPEGYQCKVSAHTCIAGNSTVPMLEKVSTIDESPAEIPAPVQLVPCPDGTSCPSGMVCCLAFPGVYGCCLGADSVCCPLRGYCCRHGYKCGPKDGCVTDNTTLPAIKKIIVPGIKLRPLMAPVTDHECPDGAECNDDQTCCELADQSYGCCPYKDAVCCSGRAHCCPNGYACDTEEKKCVKSHRNRATVSQRRLSLRSSLRSVEVRLLDNTCEDGHVCYGETTCCKTPSGKYRCCPFASGVCCSDLTHCCPQGYTCDVSTQSCKEGALYPFLRDLPMLRKFPSSSNWP
ncbi:hypothetical protein HPB47_021191 [Ixodes persulcatus]|uniref:Uncharacterized protein n=1 Tax=Ixodes persulcatus TaxID=34615 RepID=A0AC60QDB9_IXOPE|nr:hypothetical protein HPB47_021191 [Ixodes persulcatus]